MTNARVQAMKLGLMAWLVAGSLLLPVTSSADSAVLGRLSIRVAVSNGLFTYHATRIGAAISWEAVLSVNADLLIEGPNCVVNGGGNWGHCDVYVGASLPDGRFVSWVGDPQAPTLVTSAAPIPFLADVTAAETTSFRLVHRFTDPQGWYILYGLVVPAGADPLDPRRWADTYFFPFLVGP